MAALSKIQILRYNFSKEKIPSQKFLSSLIRKTILSLGDKERVEVSVIFVSPKQIRQINKLWRNKNKVTTVISFPSSIIFGQFNEDKDRKDIGEIFLCPSEIKKIAKQQQISLEKLYSHLLVHSLLHLYGFTHNKKVDSQKMEDQERQLIQLLKI